MSACRVCGGRDFQDVLEAPDVRYAPQGERYRVVRCRACGVMATWTRDAELPARPHYPSEYAAFGAPAPAALTLAGRRRGRSRLLPHVALHRFAWLDELGIAPGARVLEVGSATGKVALALAATRGCVVQGIEPDPVAAEAAREAGLDTHTGSLDDFRSDARFDVVLFVHVLEHLPDPLAALRRARELLRDGGRVVVAIPNAEGLERRLFGAAWDGWDLPRHLHHVGPEALRGLLRRAGYAPGPVRHERYSLLARSAGNRFRSDRRYAERRRSFRALRFVEAVLGPGLAALRTSSAIQVVARIDEQRA